MPYINLQITKGATREQKEEIVAEFTATLVRVLGKRPEHTHIVIQEIADEDWGLAGVLTDTYRPARPGEAGAINTPVPFIIRLAVSTGGLDFRVSSRGLASRHSRAILEPQIVTFGVCGALGVWVEPAMRPSGFRSARSVGIATG